MEYDVVISAVVAAEIFTGTNLRKDRKEARSKAISRLLRLLARLTHLISNGLPVEFEDR